MIKMSHKQLVETSKMLDAQHFDGNIYAHENRVHYLISVVYDPIQTIQECKDESENFNKLLREVIDLHATSVNSKQLAYSCGIYGNTGQLHRLNYYKDDKLIKSIFIYV